MKGRGEDISSSEAEAQSTSKDSHFYVVKIWDKTGNLTVMLYTRVEISALCHAGKNYGFIILATEHSEIILHRNPITK